MKYLVILLILTAAIGIGQIQLIEENSAITITGTSSLHDWEMDVEEFDVTGTIANETVQGLVVTIRSKSMKSGKSIMDGKAYDAVQAKEYPNIEFKAKTLTIEGNRITGEGDLHIAGNTQLVSLNAEIKNRKGSEMQIVGEVPVKMTDFEISPPTAMFGTLKTGDDLVIKYDILINN